MPNHLRQRPRAAFRGRPAAPAPSTLAVGPRRPVPFAAADLSDDDRRQLLTRALEASENDANTGYSYCWIRDVFPDYFTYEDWDDDATYKRTYTIGDDFSVVLGDPEEVIGRTVYEPVPPVRMAAFALPAPVGVAAGGTGEFNVYPDSLLFEIRGDAETFPDKGITVTQEMLAQIAAGFSGATMGLEHMDTVLGDNCGYVTDVRLVNGRQLYGTVAIPKGLDELIGDGPRRVSVELEQDEAGAWSMPQVDLVLNPRIRRAALMGIRQTAARFGSADTVDQADLRAIHALASGRGASRPPLNRGKETKLMSFGKKLLALFREEGIDVDTETPPPAGGGDASGITAAEREELERLRKQFGEDLTARRDSVKAVAVTAFGAGSQELAQASADIDAARDTAELDRLERAYQLATPPQFQRGARPGQRRTQGTQFGDNQRGTGTPPAAPKGEESADDDGRFDFAAAAAGAAKRISERNKGN